MAMQLRGYQRECLEAIRAAYLAGIRRQLFSTPTGSGKAVMLAHVPDYVPALPLLVLAHQIELVNQLTGTLTSVHPELTIGIERADQYAPESADIVVASVPTLGRSRVCAECRDHGKSPLCPQCGGSGRFLKRLTDRWSRDYFKCVIIDECHHSSCTTYTDILKYFNTDIAIGCTATPYRTDGIPLANVFDAVVYSRTIPDLTELGEQSADGPYLARMRAVRAYTKTSLATVKTKKGEFDQADLAHTVNNDPRNSIICSAIEDHCAGIPELKLAPRQSILVFAVNQAHAETLTQQLQDRGHDAAVVIERTKPSDRRERVAAFKEGRLRMLVGVNCFLEGWDAPRADCAVLARPIKSPVTYCQAIGRITRPFPGKDCGLVIDVVDICGTHQLMTAATAFGIRDMDLLGADCIEGAKRVKQIVESGVGLEGIKTLDEAEERAELVEAVVLGTTYVKTHREAVEVFNASLTPPEVMEHSDFAWMAMGATSYVLSIDKGKMARLFADLRGEWTVLTDTTQVALGVHPHPPFRAADQLVRREMPPEQRMFKKLAARWRSQPPTDKQMELLRTRFRFTALPRDLNRGTCSTLLDYLFAQSRMKRQAIRQVA